MEGYNIKLKIFSIFSIIVLVALLWNPLYATAFNTIPEDGEMDFPINGKIIIEFNYTMEIGSVEVDISPDPVYPIEKTWSNDDKILTLRPTVDLLKNKIYTVSVHGDYYNETLGSIDESFSFTTEKEKSNEGTEGKPDLPLILFITLAFLIIMVIIVIVITLLILVKNKRKSGMN